ncbi:hypothetical protein VOLCADRAFT_106884 [Volvox carteri f. nagariensis]|uniref:Right handed beta helix domain-containing protein n=1 Tax=Volvox carteri f. nagariensis TaxID=3068 RepID=D8UAE9_VOLCA|nr:uncharacterized protein VOLCADRAFT_106884 [Volvox carteri f. nagariensis]EFJ43306.1 hypothetical protein VOLCADRAFT_106884 [Volvox carteri f. nagariensis]|eukprot:XP_002955666.1 hypothetical protein VOLCADRAFT_106884 [Volvox carteri f. nagariensis]
MTVTGRGRLENNTAGGSGGAVMLKSSIDGLTHTVKWDNCSTLINNSASMKGGGLFAEVTTVKVYVVGESQWIGNTALDNGGALYIEANNSLVDVNEVSSLRVDERSQLSRNGAKSGGAIYVNGFADVQVGEGSDISLNTAKYDGGAVFLAQLPSKILVQSSSVSNNTAHRGSGGAFYVGTMEPVFQPHATEPSCVLPGAVMNASLNNATFVGNAAGVTDGGAFYLKPHETCVSSTFISLRINGSHFVENAALGAGGAVMLRDASNARFVIDIANSDFRDNTAGTVTGDFTSSANFGGALVVWREPSDAIGNFTESCQLTVNDTSFDGNSCDGGTGGAVMLISCASRFSRCNFTDNHATHSGGAMGALQMARSTATLGLVTTSTAASVAGLSQQEQSIPRDQRRLLVSDGSNMQHERISLGRVMRERDAIKDSKLWGRHRKLSAETGSCSVGSHSNAKWHTSLTACNFFNNTADREYGGAIYLYASIEDAQIFISGCAFEENKAVQQLAGAAFLAARGANTGVQVSDSSFNNNAAKLNSAGAVYALIGPGAYATLVNLSMTSNQAAVSAGAGVLDVRSNGSLCMQNAFFDQNRALSGDGGALLLKLQMESRASFNNCTFNDNKAAGNGGAMLMDGNCSSTLSVENSVMMRNQAGLSACEGGGSMSAQNCSSLVLSHSTIQNSSTSGSGGGFWAYGCRRLLLEYVNITGNIARVSGGGLTFSGPTDDIAAEGLTGNTALGGETPQYTSMIVHRARVHDNAAALSSDTLEGCQGKDSFQPGEEGKGGGFFITGKVAGVLSLVNLEQSNNASLGSAIASTQRCKQANMSTASVKATLSDTLLPSLIPSKENSTSISSQQNRVLWVEDFLPSALHVSYTAKWNCTDKIYYVSEDEAVSLNEIRLSIKDRLSEAIRRRANLTDFTPGLVLNMGALNGTIPDAAAVAAGLSQRWYKWLLGRLCMCNLPQGEDPQAAMRQQSYLALPAAYMGLRLLDTDLVYSQRLQLQPGLDINLTAQLYDMSGQAVTWDLAPSTITLALRPRTSPDATYNATVADGSAPWLDNDVANLDAGLNRSLTVPVVNGSATWEGVKTFAWPGYYSLILQLTTNYSSFAMVAPLEMEVEVLPCGVGQTLDLSHSSLKTSYTGCRACPSDQYGLWQDDRPLLTDIQPRPGNATAADDSKRQSSYSESMNITLRAQNSACMLCPANALCLGGAVIVPAPGYWHSAANSTKIHTCPYPSACNVDGDKRTFPEWIYSMVGARDYRTGLLSWCQLAWYSSVVPGAAVLSAQMPGPPPEVTGDGLQPLEVLANNTAVLLTNIIALRRQNDTAPDISLPRCLVSGLPSGHLDSYMQQQCAEGYTGNLCAACIEGYYVDTDFNCKRCPSVARTVGLGLISFFGSVALILFTTITNFSDGFGEKTNGQQHANVLPGKGGDRVEIGDVVKVIVLHLQYLIIVTRLSVNYPSIILRCQAVFSAITGAENYLVYSPSCLLPDSDSAGQAFIQWLAGILTPCAVATVSMLLWALRYAYPLREALAKAFVKGARSAWATLAGIPKSLAVWKGRQLPSSRLGTDSVCGDEDMSVCSGQRADSIGPCPPPLAPLDTSLVTQDSHIGLRTVFRDVQIVALDAADPSAGVSTGVRVPSLAYSASGSTDALASGLPTAASAAPVVDLNGVELGPAAKVIESTSCGGNEKKSGLQPSPTCDVITNAEDQSDSTSDAPGILRADDAVSPSGPPLLRGGHSINILSGGTCIETAPTEVLSGINSGYGTSYYYRHPYEMWNRKPAKTLSSMGSAAISDAIRTLHKLRTLAVHTQQSSQATFLQVDKAMSLVEQLGVVLMAAVFILYPSWANAALSTFACYPIDDGEGSFPETQQASVRLAAGPEAQHVHRTARLLILFNQTDVARCRGGRCLQYSGKLSYKYAMWWLSQATWRYGYWVRNMQAMCYSGDHLHVYVPIGVVAVVVFCVLPPLVSFIFVWRVRGRLEDAHVRKVYGFLYKRYKPRFIWWETVLELETLILVSVEVLGRGLIVSYQALLLLAAFTVIALINVSCAPLLSRLLVIMEFMSLGTLSLTITLSLYFTVDDELNPVAENALAILIIVLNTSLMLFFLYIASRHFWPSAVKKVAPRAQAVVRKLSSIGSNVSRQKDADMDGRGSEGDGQRVALCYLGTHLELQEGLRSGCQKQNETGVMATLLSLVICMFGIAGLSCLDGFVMWQVEQYGRIALPCLAFYVAAALVQAMLGVRSAISEVRSSATNVANARNLP